MHMDYIEIILYTEMVSYTKTKYMILITNRKTSVPNNEIYIPKTDRTYVFLVEKWLIQIEGMKKFDRSQLWS